MSRCTDISPLRSMSPHVMMDKEVKDVELKISADADFLAQRQKMPPSDAAECSSYLINAWPRQQPHQYIPCVLYWKTSYLAKVSTEPSWSLHVFQVRKALTVSYNNSPHSSPPTHLQEPPPLLYSNAVQTCFSAHSSPEQPRPRNTASYSGGPSCPPA